MTSCIDSQTIKIIMDANHIPKNLRQGVLCFKNDDCFPINVFNNLCCNEYGIAGQCCNMFSYIAEQP